MEPNPREQSRQPMSVYRKESEGIATRAGTAQLPCNVLKKGQIGISVDLGLSGGIMCSHRIFLTSPRT